MKTLLELKVDLTLMVLDHNGDYGPSSVMTFDYYVAADDSFMADALSNSTDLMARIYLEHRQIMREREPNDPNYIAVVGVAPRIIPTATDQPWLRGNCPVWENSNLIATTPDGYEKVSSAVFAGLFGSNP